MCDVGNINIINTISLNKLLFCSLYSFFNPRTLALATHHLYHSTHGEVFLWVWFMVFNATFNNISVISWWSVLLVEETRENHWPVASHWQTLSHNQCCIGYTSPWTGFKLTTLVVIGTDCIGSGKSNYHMIGTTTIFLWWLDCKLKPMDPQVCWDFLLVATSQ
jgi:hypothetical protein